MHPIQWATNNSVQLCLVCVCVIIDAIRGFINPSFTLPEMSKVSTVCWLWARLVGKCVVDRWLTSSPCVFAAITTPLMWVPTVMRPHWTAATQEWIVVILGIYPEAFQNSNRSAYHLWKALTIPTYYYRNHYFGFSFALTPLCLLSLFATSFPQTPFFIISS